MIRCALEALIQGNLLNTLNIIISPIETFLEPPEVEKCNRDIMNRRSEAKLQKTRKRPNLVFQSQLRLSKFLSFGQFLRHFSTSCGSKTFSMSDMMMSKVFKRLP